MKIENNATQSTDITLEFVTVDILTADGNSKFCKIDKDSLTAANKKKYDAYVNMFCGNTKYSVDEQNTAAIVERYTSVDVTEETSNVLYNDLDSAAKKIVTDFLNLVNSLL
jgi:hypothetical protein